MKSTYGWAGGALAALLVMAGCGRADGDAVEERTEPAAEQPAAAGPAQPYVAAADPIAAGRYLTVIGGCNDCHTPSWDPSFGQTPEAERLTGSPVGFQGPWGTSYPANLRLSVRESSMEQWKRMIRDRRSNPPMPWMNLHQMNDADLSAIYTYIRSLGPAGEHAPSALPPGVEPTTPYISFMPHNLPEAPSDEG